MSTLELAGVRAIVTGGASGIGLATATELASRGASVVCLDLNAVVAEPLVGVQALSPRREDEPLQRLPRSERSP